MHVLTSKIQFVCVCGGGGGKQTENEIAVILCITDQVS